MKFVSLTTKQTHRRRRLAKPSRASCEFTPTAVSHQIHNYAELRQQLHDDLSESAKKLPPDVEFHEEIRLLVYRPRGLIDETAVNKIVAVIQEIEAATQEPFNRFSDASEAHEVELNFRYVIQVSLHRRLTHKGRVPVKSAILATDSTLIHYARLLAVLTQGSSIKVRVFQDRKEAAQWLGVPLELLAAKAGGSQT